MANGDSINIRIGSSFNGAGTTAAQNAVRGLIASSAAADRAAQQSAATQQRAQDQAAASAQRLAATQARAAQQQIQSQAQLAQTEARTSAMAEAAAQRRVAADARAAQSAARAAQQQIQQSQQTAAAAAKSDAAILQAASAQARLAQVQNAGKNAATGLAQAEQILSAAIAKVDPSSVAATRAMTQLAAVQNRIGGMSGGGLEALPRTIDGLSGSALKAVTALGGVAVAMAGLRSLGQVVSIGADTEQSLNVFQATVQASDATMQSASATAAALGADLTLPATSAAGAAQAMTALGQAGLSATDAISAAKGTLQLAAAGMISEGEAAEYTANTLNQFKLAGSQATQVADLLAASISASGSSVSQTGQAVQQAGASYAGANVPLSTFITLVNEMSKAGVKGSDAGTSLKTMLARLQSQTPAAASAMQQLGVNIYDAQGAMLPMREIIGQFSTSLGGLSEHQRAAAINTIFGSDAQRAANIIFSGGVAAYDAMNAAVTRQGAAQAMAAAQMKGLNGAVAGLQSQFETLAGNAIAPLLPLMTQVIGDAATFAGSFTGSIGPAVAGAVPILQSAYAAIKEGATDIYTVGAAVVSVATTVGGGIASIASFITGGVASFSAWTASLSPAAQAALGLVAAMNPLAAVLGPAGSAFVTMAGGITSVTPLLIGVTAAAAAYSVVNYGSLIPGLYAQASAWVAANTAAIAGAGALALVVVAVAGVAKAYQDYNAAATNTASSLLANQAAYTTSGDALKRYQDALAGAGGEQLKASVSATSAANTVQTLRAQIEGETAALVRHTAEYQQFGAASGYTAASLATGTAELKNHIAALGQASTELDKQTGAQVRAAAAGMTATASAQTQTGAMGQLSAAANLTAADLDEIGKALAKNAEEGTKAFASVVQTQVGFMAEEESRQSAHADKMAALQTQLSAAKTAAAAAGIQKEIAAEQAGYSQQEQTAAASYAQQQAAQQAHLGKMLADYTLAQVQLGNVSKEASAKILASIASVYGAASTSEADGFLKMQTEIDAAAKSGDFTGLSGRLSGVQSEAVATAQKMSALEKTYTTMLILRRDNGEITPEQYATELAKIPGKVATIVQAETANADGRIAVTAQQLQSLPPEVALHVTADTAAAQSQLGAVTSAAGAVPTSTTTRSTADTAGAINGLNNVSAAAAAVPSATNTAVIANTGGATHDLDSYAGKLQSIPREVGTTVTTTYRTVGTPNKDIDAYSSKSVGSVGPRAPVAASGNKAAGGGTFVTKGPTTLTVGDNPGGAELVHVVPLSGKGQTRVGGNLAKMAGGGALLAGGAGIGAASGGGNGLPDVSLLQMLNTLVAQLGGQFAALQSTVTASTAQQNADLGQLVTQQQTLDGAVATSGATYTAFGTSVAGAGTAQQTYAGSLTATQQQLALVSGALGTTTQQQTALSAGLAAGTQEATNLSSAFAVVGGSQQSLADGFTQTASGASDLAGGLSTTAAGVAQISGAQQTLAGSLSSTASGLSSISGAQQTLTSGLSVATGGYDGLRVALTDASARQAVLTGSLAQTASASGALTGTLTTGAQESSRAYGDVAQSLTVSADAADTMQTSLANGAGFDAAAASADRAGRDMVSSFAQSGAAIASSQEQTTAAVADGSAAVSEAQGQAAQATQEQVEGAASSQADAVAGALADQTSATGAALSKQASAFGGWASSVSSAVDKVVSDLAKAKAAISDLGSTSPAGGAAAAGAGGGAAGGGASAAAGGGTFVTKGPTTLTVGDNPGGAELVHVVPLSGKGQTRVGGSLAKMGGGGSLMAGGDGFTSFAAPTSSSGRGVDATGDAKQLEDVFKATDSVIQLAVTYAARAQDSLKPLGRYVEMVSTVSTIFNRLANIRLVSAMPQPPIDPVALQKLADDTTQVGFILAGQLRTGSTALRNLQKYRMTADASVQVLNSIVQLHSLAAVPSSPIDLNAMTALADEAMQLVIVLQAHIIPNAMKGAKLIKRFGDHFQESIDILNGITKLRETLATPSSPIDPDLVVAMSLDAQRTVALVQASILPDSGKINKDFERYAATVSGSVDILSKMADLRKTLGDQKDVSPLDMALIGGLANRAREVAQIVQRQMVPIGESQNDSFKRYSETVAASISIVNGVADLRKSLSEQTDVSPLNMALVAGLATRAQDILKLVSAQLIPVSERQGEAFKRYGDAVSVSINMLKSVADLRKTLSEQTDVSPFNEGLLKGLAYQAKNILSLTLAQLVPLSEEQATAFKRYTDSSQAAVNALKSVADLRKDLADQKNVAPFDEGLLKGLAYQAKNVLNLVRDNLVPLTEQQSSELTRYADAVGKGVSVISAAADLREKLATPQAPISRAYVEALATDAAYVASIVVGQLVPTSDDLVKAFTNYASRVDSSTKIITTLADMREKLATPQAPISRAYVEALATDAAYVASIVNGQLVPTSDDLVKAFTNYASRVDSSTKIVTTLADMREKLATPQAPISRAYVEALATDAAYVASIVNGQLVPTSDDLAKAFTNYASRVDSSTKIITTLADMREKLATPQAPISRAYVEALATDAAYVASIVNGQLVPTSDDLVKAFTNYASRVDSSTKIVTTLADMREKLATPQAPISRAYVEALATDAAYVASIVNGQLVPTSDDLAKAFTNYASRVDSSTKIVTTLADMREKLATPQAPISRAYVEALATDAAYVASIVNGQLVPTSDDLAKAFTNYASRVDSSTKIITTLADMREKLATPQAPISRAYVEALATDAAYVASIVNGQLVPTSDDLVKAFTNYASRVDSSTKIVTTLADMREKLATPQAPISRAYVEALATDAAYVASIVNGQLVPTSDDLAKAFTNYASRVDSSTKIITTLADMREKLATPQAPISRAYVEALADDAQLTTRIVEGTLLPTTDDQVAGLKRYEDTVGSATGILKSVADLQSAGIGTYQSPNDAQITAIADDAHRIAGVMSSRVIPYSEEQAAAMKLYQDVVGSSVGVAKDALGLSATMFDDYVSPSDAQLDMIADDAKRFADRMVVVANTFSTDGLNGAKLFADATKATFDSFNEGLKFFEAISSGDFGLSAGGLDQFETDLGATLLAVDRLGAQAAGIPAANIAAIQSVATALGTQADTWLKLADVPWGDLPTSLPNLPSLPSGGGGGGGGSNSTTVTFNTGAIQIYGAVGDDPAVIADMVVAKIQGSYGSRK